MKPLLPILLLLLCGCGSNPSLIRFGQHPQPVRNIDAVPPMPTAGAEKLYWTTCPYCYTAQQLVAQKIKLKNTTRWLNGTMHHRIASFICSKCGRAFTSPNDFLVPDATELPPAPKRVALPPMPKASALPPKPKRFYLAWDYPGTNGPVAFSVEHSNSLPPKWVTVSSNVQASPFLIGQEGFYRVCSHRP
jgi:hypothetical protein